MVDEPDPGRSGDSEQTDTAAGAEGSAGEAGGGTSSTGWPDLDAYAAQLREEHAAWAERLLAVETQLASVRPSLLSLAAQYRALAIEEDLELLNRMVLGGTAMAQSLRLGYDLERYVSLFWPAAGDPRPTMARDDADGEYRVEVYLHLGPDGRGRVRVEGEKRLEAPLPTSRERLRSVLLSAIRSPKFVTASGTATPGDEPTAGQPHAGQSDVKQEPATPDEQPVEEASPRPGDPEDQPPPEEQVIPLGPSPEVDKGQAATRDAGSDAARA